MQEWVFGDWEVGEMFDVGVSEAYSMVVESCAARLDFAHEVLAEASGVTVQGQEWC